MEDEISGEAQARILHLIEQIERGDSFNETNLKHALGSALWKQYQQQCLVRIPDDAANLLRPYQDALRSADQLQHQGTSRRPSPVRRPKKMLTRRGVDLEYSRALELLQVLLADHPNLRTWLDRPVSFDTQDEPDTTPEDVPRLLGSRSQYARQGTSRADTLAFLKATLKDLDDAATRPSWLLPEEADLA